MAELGKLFDRPYKQKIMRVLPTLFRIAELESKRGGKVGMEVGAWTYEEEATNRAGTTISEVGGIVGDSLMVKPFGVKSRVGHNSDPFYRRRLYEKNSAQPNSTNAASTKIAKQKQSNNQPSPSASCPTDVLYHGDSRNMTELPDESVHLMVTSPPYNVGKEYDEDLSLTEYQDLLSSVFAETFRVLVDGGRACINIANVGRKPYIPLHAVVIQLMLELGYLDAG